MPARLADIARACREEGLTVSEPNKGSHWKVTGRACRVFPLPAHNGTKSVIDDKYIRALCRNFGIDEKAFKAKL